MTGILTAPHEVYHRRFIFCVSWARVVYGGEVFRLFLLRRTRHASQILHVARKSKGRADCKGHASRPPPFYRTVAFRPPIREYPCDRRAFAGCARFITSAQLTFL